MPSITIDLDNITAEGSMSETVNQLGGGWRRTKFSSIWYGPDIELFVLQNGGPSENWKWTARGWRTPDDADSADREGWVEVISREEAEKEALKFYLQKDE